MDRYGDLVTTERAPAYAGHQAHPCPVCLNVHGGELPWNESNPDWWKMQVEDKGDLAWVWLVNEWAALTERSAT